MPVLTLTIKKMKQINSISVLVIIILLLSGCGHKEDKKTTELNSKEAIPVKIASVNSLNQEKNILATGLITTENEARYSFKIGGVIDKIFVEEGQHFKKGQLLAKLKITEINSQLQQAQFGYDKAKRDYTRANNLYKDSVATLEQLQNAKTAMDYAQKTVNVVAFNQEYATIYASSDGFVSKKLANQGEVVNAGMPILAINETNKNNDWVLKLGVTDADWALIQINQSAKVQIDAFPNQVFNAKVIRKSQATDQTNGSFQIELKLELLGAKLAVGMFAKAEIKTKSTTNLPVIPYDALIEADGNNAFVFIPSNNGVKRVPIIIESFNNKHVTVKSGLENIESIIVSNSAFLNENSNIKIIK